MSDDPISLSLCYFKKSFLNLSVSLFLYISAHPSASMLGCIIFVYSLVRVCSINVRLPFFSLSLCYLKNSFLNLSVSMSLYISTHQSASMLGCIIFVYSLVRVRSMNVRWPKAGIFGSVTASICCADRGLKEISCTVFFIERGWDIETEKTTRWANIIKRYT